MVAVIVGGLAIPPASRASLRAGCVGSDDIGVPGMVGWTDAGLLFQTDPAEAPHVLQILGPNGVSARYLDGIGLRLPNAESPFWLATVHKDGQYELLVDGYDCTVTASGAISLTRDHLPSVLSPDARIVRYRGVWFALSWLHSLGARTSRTLH